MGVWRVTHTGLSAGEGRWRKCHLGMLHSLICLVPNPASQRFPDSQLGIKTHGKSQRKYPGETTQTQLLARRGLGAWAGFSSDLPLWALVFSRVK